MNFKMRIKIGAPGEDGVLINVLRQAREETMNCSLEIVCRFLGEVNENWATGATTRKRRQERN